MTDENKPPETPYTRERLDTYATEQPRKPDISPENVNSDEIAKQPTEPVVGKDNSTIERKLREAPILTHRMMRVPADTAERETSQTTRMAEVRRKSTMETQLKALDKMASVGEHRDYADDAAIRSGASEVRDSNSTAVMTKEAARLLRTQNLSNVAIATEARSTNNILLSMRNFQQAAGMKYMTTRMALHYQQVYLAKEGLRLLETIGGVIENKLEAIKLNTGASEVRKRTIADVARETLFRNMVTQAGEKLNAKFIDFFGPWLAENVVEPARDLGDAYMESDAIGAKQARAVRDSATEAKARVASERQKIEGKLREGKSGARDADTDEDIGGHNIPDASTIEQDDSVDEVKPIVSEERRTAAAARLAAIREKAGKARSAVAGVTGGITSAASHLPSMEDVSALTTNARAAMGNRTEAFSAGGDAMAANARRAVDALSSKTSNFIDDTRAGSGDYVKERSASAAAFGRETARYLSDTIAKLKPSPSAKNAMPPGATDPDESSTTDAGSSDLNDDLTLLDELKAFHNSFTRWGGDNDERVDTALDLLREMITNCGTGGGGGEPGDGNAGTGGKGKSWGSMLKKGIGNLGNLYLGAAKAPWKIASKIGGAFVKKRKRDPFGDVYRKDNLMVGDPLVTKRQLIKGLVFADGEPVEDIADITQPVLDPNTGDVLITQEDIDGGLVDVHGKDVTKRSEKSSALGAVGDLAGGGMRRMFGLGNNFFSDKNPLWSLYGTIFKTIGSVTGSFGKLLGKGVSALFKGGGGGIAKATTGILGPIIGAYKDLLGFGVNLVGGGLKSVGGAIGRLFGIGPKAGGGIGRKDLEEVIGERLEDIHDLLIERLIKPKKGDKDGDGIDDGSYEDYMNRLKQKRAERRAEKEDDTAGEARHRKGGILGGLGALGGGMFGGSRKDSAEEKDDEDDDGGLVSSLLMGGAGAALMSKLPGKKLLSRFIPGMKTAATATAAGGAAATKAATDAAAGTAKAGANTVAGASDDVAAAAAKAGAKPVANAAGATAETSAKLASKAAAKETAEKAAAKSSMKLGGKALAKSVAKKIPVLGVLAGAGFAADRLIDGDIVGAGAELASGVVSLVPWLGTGVSIGIDSWLMMRDMDKASGAYSLMTARMEAYGVSDNEKHREYVIGLEKSMADYITKGKPPAMGYDHKTAMATAFGLDPESEGALDYVSAWFNHRFSKIFGVYIKVLAEAGFEYGDELSIPEEEITSIIGKFNQGIKGLLDRFSRLEPTAQAYMDLTGEDASLPGQESSSESKASAVAARENKNRAAGQNPESPEPADKLPTEEERAITRRRTPRIFGGAHDGVRLIIEMRMLSYGVTDKSKYDAIAKLEKSLLTWDRFNDFVKGGRSIDNFFSAPLAKAFGVDVEDPNAKAKFIQWTSFRFLPLYRAYLLTLSDFDRTYTTVVTLNKKMADEFIKTHESRIKPLLDTVKHLVPIDPALAKEEDMLAGDPTIPEKKNNPAASIADTARRAEAGAPSQSDLVVVDYSGTTHEADVRIAKRKAMLKQSAEEAKYGNAAFNASNDNDAGESYSGGGGSSSAAGNDGLGSLSAWYESGERGSAAIGYDSNGGTSYGKYQIASKTGTFDKFLGWLAAQGGKAKELAKKLSEAGPPNTGSRKGGVPDAWRAAAKDGSLEDYEHGFIKATHYDAALKRLPDELRARIEASPALQDVVWSTAVQHGPGGAAGILTKANTGAGKEDDFSYVEKLYEDRGTRFPSSTAKVRASVKKRFGSEQQETIARLEREAKAPPAETAVAAAGEGGAPPLESAKPSGTDGAKSGTQVSSSGEEDTITSSFGDIGDTPSTSGGNTEIASLANPPASQKRGVGGETIVGEIKAAKPAAAQINVASVAPDKEELPPEETAVGRSISRSSAPEAMKTAMASINGMSPEELRKAFMEGNSESNAKLTTMSDALSRMVTLMEHGYGDKGQLATLNAAIKNGEMNQTVVQAPVIQAGVQQAAQKKDRLNEIDLNLSRRQSSFG